MNSQKASPAMPAILTSFAQLFEREISGVTIKAIEIPLIQRDYAQGRRTKAIQHIRDNFINALCSVLQLDAAVLNLDFVFGDVEETSGKFYPLDGQQRLTSLFLLHSYLDWRTQTSLQTRCWHNFSYATRPGARDFCAFLVKCQPNFSEKLSDWIVDQADYLPTWRHDPTIQSMLVVLDALHQQFLTTSADDLQRAWVRLLDTENPAIRFHLLPMKENGLTDAIYIKMNSRGKPLTRFENFKAHFEEMLEKVHPDQCKVFAKNVDTEWSNILWPYRGDDNLIDDEFMRYFRFVSEVCAWNSEIQFNELVGDDELSEQVYGADVPRTTENVKFLLLAFNVWMEKDIKAEFESIFTNEPDGLSTPLLMFNSFKGEGVNLFHACCRHYGQRSWTSAHTLLLYGVLLKYMHPLEDALFVVRLRSLRNLIEASDDEIRAGKRNNMPKLLIDVKQVIVNDAMQQVSTFNKVQVANELDKASLRQVAPTILADLHRLEDHKLLRGGLTVFVLDSDKFSQRAQTFSSVFKKSVYAGNNPWNLVTGALLAKGDYSPPGKLRFTDLGSPKNDGPWESLFRDKKNDAPHRAAAPLMSLLDAVAAGTGLEEVIDTFLNDPDTLKDWRYYFVRYEVMREGASGRYTLSPSGYQVCMLDKSRMNSYYRDPYLLAMVQQSGIELDRLSQAWPWFFGYEDGARKIKLINSGIEIQCVNQGWEITAALTDKPIQAKLDQMYAKHNVKNNLFAVPQLNDIDTRDRVKLGAQFLHSLVDAGL